LRFVYFNFTNNFGGAPQSMLHLARRLAERHDVHVIDAHGGCAPYIDAVRSAGLPLHVLMPEARHRYIGGAGIGRLITAARQLPEMLRLRSRLARRIHELDPDLIWVMNGKSQALLTVTRRLRHIPIAHFVRGLASRDQVGPLLRWQMNRRADAVVAVARATLANLRAAGVRPEKLHLGSNTIDIAAVEQVAREPLGGEIPGASLSPKILLLAARPERPKGHLEAVRAVARMKSAGHAPALWLPGEPAVGADRGFMDELRATIAALGVGENVFFLGWRSDIARWIRAADVCILPSHTEGFPRSVLESMVVGTPVVATPVGGIPDCVTDGETGLLTPVGDAAALAERLLRLATDPAVGRRLAAAAGVRVRREFSPEAHTQRILDIFTGLVRARRDRRSGVVRDVARS
jgi:glycosyltransferase involved in cell wall biosynthesis